MDVRVKTAVATEPIDSVFLNNFIKREDTESAETSLITSLGKAAREDFEKYTGLAFAEQTLEVSIFPIDLINNKIELPYGPHITFTSLTYYTTNAKNGAMTAGTDFYKWGNNWLTLEILSQTFLEGDIAEYRAVYTTGYGNDATEPLPNALKILMGQQVNRWYMNRGDGIQTLDSEIKRELYKWRRYAL